MKYLLIMVLLYGCSKASPLIHISPESPLALVGFTPSLIAPQKRFMGYSKSAGRASIIDPESLKETEAYTVAGSYDHATQLVGFTGLALFSQDELLILSSGQERRFPLAPFRHWTKAVNAATLSFSYEDGSAFHLIRSKGAGAWQETTFTVPWPNISSLVTLLSDDGKKVLALNPATGAYALYAAAEASDDITGPIVNCSGGLIDSVAWTAASYDSASDRLYLGNRLGAVFSVNVAQTAPCEVPSSQLSYHTTSQNMILSINRSTTAGQLLISQINGDLLTLSYDASNDGWQAGQLYPQFCDYPLYPLSLSGKKSAFVCLSQIYAGQSDDEILYGSSSIHIFSQDEGASLLSWPVDFDNIAGAAIDPDTAVIFIMRESALGIIDAIDPATSSIKTRKGLFLDNILNEH